MFNWLFPRSFKLRKKNSNPASLRSSEQAFHNTRQYIFTLAPCISFFTFFPVLCGAAEQRSSGALCHTQANKSSHFIGSKPKNRYLKRLRLVSGWLVFLARLSVKSLIWFRCGGGRAPQPVPCYLAEDEGYEVWQLTQRLKNY
uniref:hypothetical protein n=1 Tax=Ramaria rubella TaxID=113071 RepID=UPI00223872AB|nr:hypothetical protein OQ044_mgp39 [Ramaria rubella]UYR22240.1 hypothetical protein [Ramaria rubella]